MAESTETVYVVEIKNEGFYVRDPWYDWVFSKDVSKACEYKTDAGARERGMHISYHSGKPFRIVPVRKIITRTLDISESFDTAEEIQRKQSEARKAARGPIETITLAQLIGS